MKTSDITNHQLLCAILSATIDRQLREGLWYWGTASRWDVTSILAGHLENVGTNETYQDYPNMPWKIVLSAARRAIRKKLISGCPCGCRGDFEIPNIKSRCPKCRTDQIHWMWPLEEPPDFFEENQLNDNRTCYRCGYEWPTEIGKRDLP